MGQTTEELRERLEFQREALGRDLTAIGDRVSPGRVVERRKAAVRQRFTNVREAVMGVADGAGSAAGGATSAVGSAATGAASSVGSGISSAAGSVADTISSAPQAVRTQTQGSPMAAGLIAFGAGFLAASLLPQTKAEQRSAQRLQPALESAASQAGASAHEVVADLREEAKAAAEDLKASAQESVETVKAEASDAVSQAADQAKSAADAVQQAPQQAGEAPLTQTQPVPPGVGGTGLG